MVALLVPYVPEPTQEQREALRLASAYLARSYDQAGSRLLGADPWEPQVAMVDDIRAGLRQAASLIDALAELGDDECTALS
jgi:hypothetical protein